MNQLVFSADQLNVSLPPEQPPAKRIRLDTGGTTTDSSSATQNSVIPALFEPQSNEPITIPLLHQIFYRDYTNKMAEIRPGPGRHPGHYTLWMKCDDIMVQCLRPVRPETSKLFKIPYWRADRFSEYDLGLSSNQEGITLVGYTPDKEPRSLGYVELKKPLDGKISSPFVYRFLPASNPFTEEEAKEELLSLVKRLSAVAEKIFYKRAAFNRHGLILHAQITDSSKKQITRHYLYWTNRGCPSIKCRATYHLNRKQTHSLLITKEDLTYERCTPSGSKLSQHYINGEEATSLAIPFITVPAAASDGELDAKFFDPHEDPTTRDHLEALDALVHSSQAD